MSEARNPRSEAASRIGVSPVQPMRTWKLLFGATGETPVVLVLAVPTGRDACSTIFLLCLSFCLIRWICRIRSCLWCPLWFLVLVGCTIIMDIRSGQADSPLMVL